MNGPEHYREAERLADLAADAEEAHRLGYEDADWRPHAALAQIHATLAHAAATAGHAHTVWQDQGWYDLLGGDKPTQVAS